MPSFTTKVIAFVDILGFKEMVAGAGDHDLPQLLDLLGQLGKPLDVAKFAHGPTACLQSTYDHPHLDFAVTQVSDCVVVSAERTPGGVINLLSYCYHMAVRLLQRGYLCRGAIVIGPIYHRGTAIVGEGYQRAYAGELAVTAFSQPQIAHSAGGPFIEVGSDVVRYIAEETDACVRQMFDRMTHSDASVTAIYPFHLLAEAHFTTVDARFDPRERLATEASWRKRWGEEHEKLTKRAEQAPAKVAAKFAHVLHGIDFILARSDDRLRQLNHMIDTGRRPPEGSVWGNL